MFPTTLKPTEIHKFTHVKSAFHEVASTASSIEKLADETTFEVT